MKTTSTLISASGGCTLHRDTLFTGTVCYRVTRRGCTWFFDNLTLARTVYEAL
jgi:hypothetical protein